MSKKTQRRRKLETVDSSARDATRLTGVGLGLGLMLAAGSAVVWWWLSTRAAQPPSIAVPSPDTSTMEPQVAARIRAAQQAVRDNRASASAWGMLGMVLHAHELTADAAACYEGASRLDPESGRWLYLLARARQTEEPVRAKAAAMEAARSMPSFLPARLLVAELEEATSQEEAALDAYRAALELDASAAAAEFGVARLLLASGKLDEGLRHLERAATLAPESGAIQASLARSYGRAGRTGDARAAAARAKRLDPAVTITDPLLASVAEQAVSVVGLMNRGREAEARGETALAEDLLRRMIELRPHDADLHYNLANHFSRNGRTAEAIEQYRLALSIDPAHADALVNLGILVSDTGELVDAARLYERALAAAPRHAGALSGQGHVAAREGRFADARDWFLRALAADAERPDTNYALAQTYLFLDRPRESVPYFVAAIAGAPERVALRLELAEVYARVGEIGEAWREVGEAERLGVPPSSALLERLRSHEAEVR